MSLRIFAPMGALLLLGGCQSSLSATAEQAAAAQRAGVKRLAIDTGGFTGLSDLTIDAAGHFWSLPERSPNLLRLNLTRDRPGLDDAPIPLDGVPEGADTESLVWLSDNHFAIGTETQVQSRASDTIMLIAVEGGRAKVTETITLPYKLWHMRANANDGIEGLCAAGNQLLAGVETVERTADGKRYAPIARYDLAKKQWTPYALLLTSKIGKISGLACRLPKGSKDIEVVAIERHFGVSRLLRFHLPANAPAPAPILPEVLVDFGQVIDAVPNFEGAAWSPEGDLFVLSDNDFGIVTGPTQIVVIPRNWR